MNWRKFTLKLILFRAYHGKVAEASFRQWLSEFMPKRFGVTAGRIISQGFNDDVKAPHYDVIIYDQLNAPVLWIEESPDLSRHGKTRALPAEYVYSVIEVKSVLNARSASKALETLEALRPLLEEIEPSYKLFKQSLPGNFCSAVVFFEVMKKDQHHKGLLNNLVPRIELRGYSGGLIFKGEEEPIDVTGRLMVTVSESPQKSFVGKKGASIIKGWATSDSIQYPEKEHAGIDLIWSHFNFSSFVFDLVSALNDTFRPGYQPTFYGMSYLNPERAR